MCAKSLQLCPTLCDPMDHSLPGSSVHLILQSFLTAQLVKNLPAMQRFQFNSWVRKICWRKDRLPMPVFLGFPCGSARYLVSIPWLGRSPREGKGHPFQYSSLENSMDCIEFHEVAKSWTRLSDFHYYLQRIFPTQGLNLRLIMSPELAGGFFTTSATWKAHRMLTSYFYPSKKFSLNYIQ